MSDINKYRELMEASLKFFLIEISKEQVMNEIIQKRLNLLSHLSVTRFKQVNLDELVSPDFNM
ncbi:hypothetical protein D3C85_1811080 [compost metagenome]